MRSASAQASICGVPVLETDRLHLSRLAPEDAPFILRLVNDPSWLRYIGDRGVHTLDDARRYIADGPMKSYERNGFGLYRIDSKASGKPIGMCGLIRREGLDGVDLGFALFPDQCGAGIATEAGAAVVEEAKALGLRRLLAITVPANVASIRVLQKLGFSFERNIELKPGETLELHARAL